MPSILHLPPELLVTILGDLNPFDLLSVLQTFNRNLYGAADPLLRPFKPWIQNAQSMTALFPPETTHSTRRLCPSYPPFIAPFNDDCVSLREEIARKDQRRLSLDPNNGPYIRCSPPDLITWMKLDGTFGWLEPLRGDLAEEMATYNGVEGDRPMAPKTQVDTLVKQASSLGLRLPTGFESFLRSDTLHHRFPSFSAWYFKLSKLIKCPPSIDDGKGGYLCRFHFDQQSCAFGYLYLSLSGGHCVLVSQTDVYSCLNEDGQIEESISDETVDRNEDVQSTGEGEETEEESIHTDELEKEYFSIAGLSLEEYLVTVYFEGLLSFEAESSKGLDNFVKHVYRSPAEVEHMRETSKLSTGLDRFIAAHKYPDSAIKLFLDAQRWKGKVDRKQFISD